MTMKPLRVLVVDDSSFNRKVISEILEGAENVEVVGKAFDGEDAIRKVVRLAPDAMTLDLEMPNMDGFAVLRWVMANRPMPVIVVSARESDRSVFKALDLGAVDFVVKPSRIASPNLKNIEGELLAKMRAVPSLSLERLKRRASGEDPIPEAPKIPSKPPGKRRAEVVLLAASTGGPPALQAILQGLHPRLRSPVIICQHMPPVFTRLFAERLSQLTGRTVKEAEDGEFLAPRTIYVAQGGKQTRILASGDGLLLRVTERKPEDRFAPCANVLFLSAAEALGKKCLAAVLTGMGDDGKEGAIAIRAAGGTILAESEDSAVIFGMPKEVIRAGAADFTADVPGITEIINTHALLDEGSLQST